MEAPHTCPTCDRPHGCEYLAQLRERDAIIDDAMRLLEAAQSDLCGYVLAELPENELRARYARRVEASTALRARVEEARK